MGRSMRIWPEQWYGPTFKQVSTAIQREQTKRWISAKRNGLLTPKPQIDYRFRAKKSDWWLTQCGPTRAEVIRFGVLQKCSKSRVNAIKKSKEMAQDRAKWFSFGLLGPTPKEITKSRKREIQLRNQLKRRKGGKYFEQTYRRKRAFVKAKQATFRSTKAGRKYEAKFGLAIPGRRHCCSCLYRVGFGCKRIGGILHTSHVWAAKMIRAIPESGRIAIPERTIATHSSGKVRAVRATRDRMAFTIRRCGAVKSASAFTLVGCTPEQLLNRLESGFKRGMNWENYGRRWVIDHIIPCESFDLSIPEQQRACFHYTNLRPLRKTTNSQKSWKMPPNPQPELRMEFA